MPSSSSIVFAGTPSTLSGALDTCECCTVPDSSCTLSPMIAEAGMRSAQVTAIGAALDAALNMAAAPTMMAVTAAAARLDTRMLIPPSKWSSGPHDNAVGQRIQIGAQRRKGTGKKTRCGDGGKDADFVHARRVDGYV